MTGSVRRIVFPFESTPIIDETNAAWQANARFWCDGRATSVNLDTQEGSGTHRNASAPGEAGCGAARSLRRPGQQTSRREPSPLGRNREDAHAQHPREAHAQDRTHAVMIALRRGIISAWDGAD